MVAAAAAFHVLRLIQLCPLFLARARCPITPILKGLTR